MIDHLTLTMSDLAKAKAFYAQALAPLGYAIQMEFGDRLGIGSSGMPTFWLKRGQPATPPMHLAFASPNRQAVDAFYQAAIAAGARDNGAPGLREDYHPHYYAAFVFDPFGHPIEAVCHRPEKASGKAPASAPAKKTLGKRSPAK